MTFILKNINVIFSYIFVGSPMWLPHRKSVHSVDANSQDLHMFIFCLRALVRSAHAVAVITIPSYLYDEVSNIIIILIYLILLYCFFSKYSNILDYFYNWISEATNIFLHSLWFKYIKIAVLFTSWDTIISYLKVYSLIRAFNESVVILNFLFE